MAKFYYTAIKGQEVTLYDETKFPVRKFRLPKKVVQAQVSGAGSDTVVAISMEDGRSRLYRWDGTLIRS